VKEQTGYPGDSTKATGRSTWFRWRRTIFFSCALVCVALLSLLGVRTCAHKGTATLTWAPVTTDIAGKTLKDLAGYKIHYGTSATEMSSVVVLKDPNQTTYVVKGLYPSTWYFAVSAYTVSGDEGAPSPVVADTIK
jgi:hypothetical protein